MVVIQSYGMDLFGAESLIIKQMQDFIAKDKQKDVDVFYSRGKTFMIMSKN